MFPFSTGADSADSLSADAELICKAFLALPQIIAPSYFKDFLIGQFCRSMAFSLVFLGMRSSATSVSAGGASALIPILDIFDLTPLPKMLRITACGEIATVQDGHVAGVFFGRHKIRNTRCYEPASPIYKPAISAHVPVSIPRPAFIRAPLLRVFPESVDIFLRELRQWRIVLFSHLISSRSFGQVLQGC